MTELTFLKIYYVIKICASKKCNICHYWYFLDNGFKFQLYVCNRPQDVSMMPINPCSIVILNICSVIVVVMELAKFKA